MKPLVVILGVLLLLSVVLAASVRRQGKRPSPECTENIVIVKGADGRPLECVCIDRAIATCFNPGP